PLPAPAAPSSLFCPPEHRKRGSCPYIQGLRPILSNHFPMFCISYFPPDIVSMPLQSDFISSGTLLRFLRLLRLRGSLPVRCCTGQISCSFLSIRKICAAQKSPFLWRLKPESYKYFMIQ